MAAWEQHRASTAPAELIWEDATWTCFSQPGLLKLGSCQFQLIWEDATWTCSSEPEPLNLGPCHLEIIWEDATWTWTCYPEPRPLSLGSCQFLIVWEDATWSWTCISEPGPLNLGPCLLDLIWEDATFSLNLDLEHWPCTYLTHLGIFERMPLWGRCYGPWTLSPDPRLCIQELTLWQKSFNMVLWINHFNMVLWKKQRSFAILFSLIGAAALVFPPHIMPFRFYE